MAVAPVAHETDGCFIRTHHTYTASFAASAPIWPFAGATAVLPLARWRARLNAARRRAAGLCPSCGYDLCANVSGVCRSVGALNESVPMSETSPTPLPYATRSNPRRHVRLVLLVAAVAVSLFVPAAVRNALRAVRHPGRPLVATIQVVDVETGAPLQVAVSGPPIPAPSDPWSITYTTLSFSRIRIAWR
jgi:hypothetical protein